MALNKVIKKELVTKYQISDKDTGSPEVQIALLTQQINELNKHLSVHIHDFSSKRGLFIRIGQRKKLLNYLKSISLDRYQALIKELGIRR